MATKKKQSEEADVSEGKMLFEEWRMEHKFEGKEHRLEKLKLVRNNVLITQQTADTLNSGAISPDSVNPIMYFLPEQDA